MKANKTIRPKFSLYDKQNNPEHDLFEEYAVEFNDISGIEIEYYRSRYSDVTKDRLYGEPMYQNLDFEDAKKTKVIYEMTEEPISFSSFGVNSEDTIIFAFIPKFTFKRDVSQTVNPKTGDVIKTLWNSRSYEVVDVGEEAHIFQLSKKIWELILKPYRFSEESDDAINLSNDLDTTLTNPSSAFGDNQYVEDQSDIIDDYDDVDTTIYGY